MTLDYASCEYYLAAAQLVLATLGMGVSLKVTDFWQVLRAPKAIALVLAAQLFLAPLMVWALASGLSLPPGIVPGMVLMMAMPVGALANIFCYLGRGNMPLAVSATAISTLGCLITAAAVVRCFGSAHFPVEFSMPVGRVVLEISVCLMLPLAVAMIAGRLAPSWSQRIGKWCMRGALLTLTTLIVGSIASGRLTITAYGWLPPLMLIALGGVTLLVCYGLGFLLRMSSTDSFTVAVLVTVRNGNLALLLKASCFPALAGVHDPVADGVLFVILFYSGVSLAVSAGAAYRKRVLERIRQRTSPHPPMENVSADAQADGVCTASSANED